jgi:2,4-dienoyl-CoA reductase-like NADH-dependent reductase (Old Yellow Enzyme family)
MSHPDNTPHGRQPVAPSAVAPGVDMFTAHGMQPIPEPRALAPDEIAGTVADFVLAARRAIEAGADGVELHGANGYLIHQFFAPNANLRTDLYGGLIENRIRFALEVAAAVADAIGPQRTGFRISPGVPAGGLVEGEEGPELYRRLIAELDRLGLAYLHILHAGNDELLTDIRRLWRHALLVNRPGRPRERIGSDIMDGLADIETYGQMALANPDLAERIRRGAALNPAKREAYYRGGAAGYTDYPALPEAIEQLETAQ